MVDHSRVAELGAVALVRDLVRRWWGVELTLADARGAVLATARGAAAPGSEVRGGWVARVCGAARARREPGSGDRRAFVHAGRSGEGLAFVVCPIRFRGEFAGCVLAGVAPSRRLPAAATEQLMDLLEAAADAVQGAFAEAAALELRAASPPHAADPATFGIIGRSRAMQDVFRLVEKVAGSEATVLIQGESGTGKELIARAVHDHGPRARQPFVAINCAALPETLLESELFGHAKGAFTGAVCDKKGLFQAADGGSFFLDEVGEMSPALQTKLLRVLEEGAVTPLGSTREIEVDVRVIAASKSDLEVAVAEGRYRKDLYYRLDVIRVDLPPLRARIEDLPLLVEHFLNKHRLGCKASRPAPRLDDAAMATLAGYAWPGNIRELENEIERLLVLGAEHDVIPSELLSPRIAHSAGARPARGNGEAAARGTLRARTDALEREMIREGLARTLWNKSRLAKDLGVSRSNLIAKIHQFGLDRKRH
ncbi:MAG: sigma 54-interacting transcriptional regulator [Myxococcota bacterium]